MFKRGKKINRNAFAGGYRQFRNPSVFKGEKVRPEFKLPKIKVSFKLIFWLVAFVFIVYGVFFSKKFLITEVIIEGNKMVAAEKIAGFVPKGKNILFFSSKDAEEDILKSSPEIKDVFVYRGIPNAVKVVVAEHEGKMVWQSGGEFFLISSTGKVAKKLTVEEIGNLPLVVDKKNVGIKVGDNIVSESFIAFVVNIFNQILPAANISPDHFEVEETTFDVNLVTKNNFYVKLNTMRASTKQLDSLKRVLLDHKDKIHEYIDLRVDGWAYYK